VTFAFPSAEWVAAYGVAINASETYRSASLNWTFGAVALVVAAQPAIGLAEPAAIWLDLDRGVCRAARLVPAALVCLALGAAWSLVFPLNKNLWTSSFVLWTGGWALLALAVAHAAIDRRRWPAIGRSLGVNAIAVYAGSWLMVCALEGLHWSRPLYRVGFAWMTPATGPYLPSLAWAVAFVALWWGIAVVMERRN